MTATLTLNEIRAMRWEPHPSPKAPGRWVVTTQTRHISPGLERDGWRLSRRDRCHLLERKVGPFAMIVKPGDAGRVFWSVMPHWRSGHQCSDGMLFGHPDELVIEGVLRCEAAVVALGKRLIMEVQR